MVKPAEPELANMKATREVCDASTSLSAGDGLYDGEGENGSGKTF